MPPRQTLEGFLDLSPREREVAILSALGRPDSEIANTLNIAPRTVSTYLKQIKAKACVQTRTEIAVYAVARYGSQPISLLNGESLLERIARTQKHGERAVLTDAERKVLDILAAGAPTRHIAAAINSTERHVRELLGKLESKLGLDNKMQLAVYWSLHGYGHALDGQNDTAYSQGNSGQNSNVGRQPNLTARELEVLGLMTLKNNLIAKELNISPHTVRASKRNIFAKFGVRTAQEAAAYAAEHGIGYNAAAAVTSAASGISALPELTQSSSRTALQSSQSQ